MLIRIERSLAHSETVLLALLLVGLVVVSAAQVLLRTVWGTAIDWADGVLQNATLMIGLLGAAVATSEGRHLNIDVLRTRLRGRVGYASRALVGLFALTICALLSAGGWTTFSSSLEPWLTNMPPGWSVARTLAREIGDGLIPAWLTQLMFPLGFGLIGLHFALRMVRDGASAISGEAWEPPRDEPVPSELGPGELGPGELGPGETPRSDDELPGEPR